MNYVKHLDCMINYKHIPLANICSYILPVYPAKSIYIK